jgi:ferredoxin
MGVKTRLGTKLIRRVFHKRFSMARMTNLPLLGPLMEFVFFEEDDMMVLPKDSVFEGAVKDLKTIEVNAMVEPLETVLPSQVVEHFIRNSKYIFLMDRCMCRDANHCNQYPIELGCLFLGRGVLKIDQNLGRRVTQEEALDHLRKCREAGLVHLIGRNKIDSVWLSTGPKEDLLSLCSCCPCCCLWKMIPDLSPEISGMVTMMPGLTIRVDGGECTGCGSCERSGVCYVDAIKVEGDKAVIDEDFCKGCGRCIEVCPNSAIELKIEDLSFMESSIKRIEPLVDVSSD